jgi:acyl-CoA synthetase (NDP forming)
MKLKSLYFPESLAVIGVSLSNYRHPANVIYSKNLLRYPARVYPVNPKGGILQGEEVFAGIGGVPEAVDLAVIAVRAELVPTTMAQCIDAGVKAAIVITGGFSEIGRGDLQKKLTGIARQADFPFVGPNCLGIYSPDQVDTFFLPSERMVQPERGRVAVVSQSGGILVDLLVKFANAGIGLSSATSIGNKAFLREEHFLRYLEKDRNTSVIAFYIEGFNEGEGRSFVEAASSCPKPVVVLKAGRTAAGSRAVSSHTASLAGDYRIFSNVLAQNGIVEAKNERELLSFCSSLSCYQRSSGVRLGIVSGSGGHGAMAVDACQDHGLEIPLLSKDRQSLLQLELSDSIRSIASLSNPIDLTGSAIEEDFVAAVTFLSSDESIDCLMVLLLPYLPGISSDLGARLSQISKKIGKPLIAYVPHVEKYRMLIEGFELNQVPVSSSIEGADGRSAQKDDSMRKRLALQLEAARGKGWLMEPEAKKILQQAGIAVPRFTWAKTIEGAVAFAETIGYPVAAKIVSPSIIHKSDAGGVASNIDSKEKLGAFFLKCARLKKFSGLVVEERLEGIELIVGAKADFQFGPVILLGIGGTAVEIYHDVAIRMAPLTACDARSMLKQLKGGRLLTGYRGEKPINQEKLISLLLSFSVLFMKIFDAVESIDLNPVFCNAEKCVVADARFMLHVKEREEEGLN